MEGASSEDGLDAVFSTMTKWGLSEVDALQVTLATVGIGCPEYVDDLS